MSDIPFINKILLKVSHGNVRLFRNSVGLGWVGKSIRFNAPTTFKAAQGDVLIRRARPLHAGLTVGSGDLIGWTSIEITPEMVGQRVAVLTSLEAKEGTGRSTPEQVHWREQVRQAGGIASEVRSVEDAIAAVSAAAVSAAVSMPVSAALPAGAPAAASAGSPANQDGPCPKMSGRST